MKKLFYIFTLFIIFSCTHESFLTEEQPANLTITKSDSYESISDVFVEKGVLHFKNLNAVDSIFSLLSPMTPEERINWERSIGFESAISYYDSYMDYYNSLSNDDEINKFIQENLNTLQITEYDDGDVDVDYPFEDQTMLPILSKDGRVYIGKSLFICKKDRRIDINDFTEEKIAYYENATQSNPNELVFVHYPEAKILTKAEFGTNERTITYYRHPDSGYETRDKKKIRYAVQSFILYNQAYNGTKWETKTYVGLYFKFKRRKQDYSSNVNIDNVQLRGPRQNTFQYYGNFSNNDNKGGRYFIFFESVPYYSERQQLLPPGTNDIPAMRLPTFTVKFDLHSAAFPEIRPISVSGNGDDNLDLLVVNRF